MKEQILGLVNFHDSPSLGQLTVNRSLGSTSFIGRFAFCDFPLSNFCNSGVSTVGLLVADHQRSIIKHLGSMDAWVTNTKLGHFHIMFNESATDSDKLNTDIANIKFNDYVLYDSPASYIVIMPTHIVCSIDIQPILAEHIARKDKITYVATKIHDASNEYLSQQLLTVDHDGYVTESHPNSGKKKGPALADMGIAIINRATFESLLRKYHPANPTLCLRELIELSRQEGVHKVHVHLFNGYARCFDSFKHYMDYSFELLKKSHMDALFSPDWPIYTLTHDTPPAVYGDTSKVNNSFISNGAVIQGTVENSIIARNVKVGKGAVVRNSIIFSSSTICEDALVENALIDKYSIVTRNHKLVGQADNPTYIEQSTLL